MAAFSSYLIPLTILFIFLYGILHNTAVFDSFVKGAAAGIKTSFSILPALVMLVTAVGMLKASGGMDLLSYALAPVGRLLSIPGEVIPLALLRPISGSSALVIFKDILTTYGPDSMVGKTASVMMGSTETTFYTIAVYYGANKITESRHTVAASLVGDLTGFIMSAMMVRLLFGG